MNNKTHEPLFHVVRQNTMPWYKVWGIRALSIIFALLVCAVVTMIVTGDNPIEVYKTILYGGFGTPRKTWILLQSLAILLCVSLAVTPAFRMRFWNIGAEGQTLVGVLGAIGVDFYLGGKIPEALLLIIMLLAALVCGAVWGLIPAIFKALWNTNETLFTLMMNYVATYLVAFFLVVWVPSGSSSLAKMNTGKLPVIGGNDYLLIILIVLTLTVGLYIYLNYSKHGYEINVVGESVNTARYVGIEVRKVIIRTMILSGLLCGLTGYLIAAGLDQTVTTNSVGGQGFIAIMVSWLAKFNPLTMILTSGFIQILSQGASQISQDFNVSGALPDVITGIMLFCIIGCEFFINYKVNFRRHSSHEGSVKGAGK